MEKKQKIFLLWFLLVVAWNFLVPRAKPAHDVIAAVFLSWFSKILNQKN